MTKPLPIRSPLDSKSLGPKDYSYTNPLKASGDDYPCKGYANDTFVSQEVYVQGSSYNVEIEGNAVHGGGSCQLALTYNRGQSFKVLKSIEGGCGVNKEWTFEIPKDAPPGEALFAWTWFNKVGNREMYMNCAMVTIGDANIHASRLSRRWGVQRATHDQAFQSLPELFIANVNGEGKCVTIEGEDVAFPLPGPNLVGKSDTKGYKCYENATFLGLKAH
ncbi:hypothetical protein BDV33DRAFT_187050 [Aspergillus novoparasiticus]|uniref:Endoglucanase n=1 Tax=Aspergillus novoparasiticus TaxID=986946 RepID=A0A5N6F730_9EURO|nr:hypothetical protein BDV33DRAFT_187050 [Aspergillus novoparasiticus]